TMTEYLENESKFLLDLVADQYKGTVVLVSEDPKARNELTTRLKASGYAVVLAQTPEIALEKVEKINPNVILCEQKFSSDGALSGIKFMHVLRTNSKLNFIPCILFCEKNDLESLKVSELRPNEAIIKKPVDFDELTAVMNEKLIQFREYISSMV
ncbi:MAG TPA: response regulator, partial [Bacteroidota bacterium]|nr:response regulator [Bacteroidota bacterium]